MSKLEYIEYVKLVIDPNVDEKIIMDYSIVMPGEGAFDYRIMPNPRKVSIPEHVAGNENAMAIGNDWSRSLRKNRFERRMQGGRKLPVIVTEGDSWFQFPLIIDDVVDHLEKHYFVYSVGAAGDTAKNMTTGPRKKKGFEYLDALLELKDHVRAFALSAAGNDIIGEDPDTEEVALEKILKQYNGNPTDVVGHIDYAVLNERLSDLKTRYQGVFDTVRAQPEFTSLPIIIHGYDYVFPYPWTTKKSDPRNPKHAKKNAWLGKPLDAKGITPLQLRRDILKALINQLYSMFGELVSDPKNSNVFIVDCRDAMPDVGDWADEIHGTSDGFKAVAERFKATLDHALS